MEDALLQFPFTIVQRADVPRFEPARDAVEVECVLYGATSISSAYSGSLDGIRTLQIPQAALHSSLVAET